MEKNYSTKYNVILGISANIYLAKLVTTRKTRHQFHTHKKEHKNFQIQTILVQTLFQLNTRFHHFKFKTNEKVSYNVVTFRLTSHMLALLF